MVMVTKMSLEKLMGRLSLMASPLVAVKAYP